MCGCIVDRKRPVYEGDIVAVEEILCNIGGYIRCGGELRVGGAVDAVEDDLAVVIISKGTAVYAEAKGRHVLEKVRETKRRHEERKKVRGYSTQSGPRS
jgi:hypothetical protein